MTQLIDLSSVSRFVRRVLGVRPKLAAELESPAPFSRAQMVEALAERTDEAAFKRELRRLRERVLLRVMARDLVAHAPLEEICGTMSDLAVVSIAAALDWLRAPELVVVGMGKLGGRELNVSSDIDLVFLHSRPEDAERVEGPARRACPRIARGG